MTDIVWVYDVVEMGEGISYTVFNRLTRRLVTSERGTVHFSTEQAATDYAVGLAKRHSYEKLVRELR